MSLKFPHLTPCQEWEGGTCVGYGWVSKERKYAHRWAWEQTYGAIPAGLEIMHLCDNKLCVNLDHLALGTHAMNMAMAGEHGLMNNRQAERTHCKHGHEFTEANTYHPPKRPTHRHCRTCRLEAVLRYRGGQ